MWLRVATVLLCVIALGLSVWGLMPWAQIQQWAASEQRSFQNSMAVALRAIQNGEPWAVWALCSATAAYGFFHALGPGHGKILIGGAALASGATLRRLSILTVLSSLAQAATAIAIVGGLVFFLRMQSGDLTTLTEAWLAPASYAAIALIGAVLVVRGGRMWHRLGRQNRAAQNCCGHAHGPSVAEINTLNSTRDALALIASIALRPCTGALFVLLIAARFDAFATGCLAVVTMGLGTAAFNLSVAGSGIAARKLAGLGARDRNGIQAVSATLHIIGGTLIAMLSTTMLLPFIT